jgi:hypothetical protein
LSLDFGAEPDNISHANMEQVLPAHGFSKWFTECILRLYVGASYEVQTSGFCSSLIPIRSSIRQGCPLSVLLFALCLNPLLHSLDDSLSGIKIGQDNTKVAVAPYADDVTVFLTSPVDSQKLQEILSTYDAASGAKVNRQKLSALALGHWDGSSLISNIPYSQSVKILGFKFTNSERCSEHVLVYRIITSAFRCTGNIIGT